jgi:site-specific DNA-methyltransferase (adenine-specific)
MMNLADNPHLHKTDVSRSTLFWADCFDVFPSIPNKSIDAIIADLPYGTTACKWDSILPLDKLWQEYKRILKDSGCIVLTATNPFAAALIMSEPKMFKYEWIWDKVSHSNPFVAKYRCLAVHEQILVFAKGKTTYNPQMVKNNFVLNGDLPNGKHLGELFINKNKGAKRNDTEFSNPKSIIQIKRAGTFGKQDIKNEHPTAKPIELMEYLVKTYTNENEIVLDNTMGSGTTGLACLKTNRQFIGIEKEKQYYDVAVRRLSEYCG